MSKLKNFKYDILSNFQTVLRIARQFNSNWANIGEKCQNEKINENFSFLSLN